MSSNHQTVTGHKHTRLCAQLLFPTKDRCENTSDAGVYVGMTDIARQTVEFLYEENGGMPRDLHLPTIDDIREELAKFTIERVRKGTTVVIRTPSTGSSVLPKYAIRGMMKTFGLTGVVLDVDQVCKSPRGKISHTFSSTLLKVSTSLLTRNEGICKEQLIIGIQITAAKQCTFIALDGLTLLGETQDRRVKSFKFVRLSCIKYSFFINKQFNLKRF